MIPLYDDNPRTTVPIVTIGIIIVNVLVFIWQQAVGPDYYLFTMVPSAVTGHGGAVIPVPNGPDVTFMPAVHPYWLTIFTSMFMHGSILHIGGNMLYLWIFGDNIEDDIGHFKYLVFYLLVGFLAAAAHIASNPVSHIPTLGASGAIAGVMGGYILLHPKSGVRCLVPIGFFSTLMTVPAYIVLGFWFVYQVVLNQVGRMGDSQGGGVAYMAHIGGFVAGLILIKLFGPKTQRQQPAYYRDWQ